MGKSRDYTNHKDKVPAAPLNACFLQRIAKTGSFCLTTKKELLVFIFEGKGESLSGEVSEDIGQVIIPEEQNTLLLGNTNLTAYNAFVLLFCSDFLAGMLHLQ